MKSLMKSVLVIGQVLGLLIGYNVSNPTLQVPERYPYLRFNGRFPAL